MSAQMLKLNDKPYVLLERAEYNRLKTMAKASALPPLPDPDKKGNYPATEYINASIARDIISERAELGLKQVDLAELAGVRVETLSRIETGKHTPSVRTIDKIDSALKKAQQNAQKKNKPTRKLQKRAVG